MKIIGIRGIIHYSRQVCNLIFLAFQYSSPGGSTTAGEVCYLRLPCCRVEKVDAVEHELDSVTDESVSSVDVDNVEVKFVTCYLVSF